MATRVVMADPSQGSCGAASIRANGHNIQSQGTHIELDNRPAFTYEVCLNFLPRPKYAEQLHAHFARANHHGQFARVILWGQAGFGKQQLAIHFAIEYGRRSGRKVLWVDGEGIETLVRDYRQAYLALTGSQVLASSPYFSLHYMLSHIKRTLEKRHDEWLLVLLNAGSDTENPDPHASGLCPADYLPTCGQTLVTTSSVFGEITAQNGATPRLWMGLKLVNTLAINIEGLEPHEKACYYEKVCGGSREDIEQVRSTESFGLGFPELALALSHMRWLQLDPLRYASVREPSLDKSKHKREDAVVPRGISPGYPSTLDSIWWSVIDSDSIAAQLLLYISLFGPRHLPWNLLQRIWDLKEMNARELLQSRNLLAAIGLISINSPQNGMGDELNVHSLLHQWLRNRVRETYNNEAEYTHAMFDVVDMMANFVMHDAVHDRNKLWNIIGHILRIVGMCTKHGLESSSCAALFSHVALFLYNEGAFVRLAERLINGAISTAILVAKVSGERDHGGHCLASMRETRVRILLFLLRPQEANVELMRAIAETKIFPVEDEQKQPILRRLRDLEAEVAFLDDDHQRVMRILEADLKQECFSDSEKARKHHWMAKSLIVSGSVRQALRHSHMAVSYWYGLPDRWHQAEMLRWVDWHTTVLKCAGKWNAASLILPDLLEHYLEFVPPTSEEVWRAACGLGRTLAHAHNVYGHEALTIKILLAANVTELHGHSLTYCLMMLRDFASALQARGRLVEAEGIYRHNIDVATCKKPPELGDDGSYDYTKDRMLLVACVYSQGRRKEARTLLGVFKTQEGFHDNPTAHENLSAVLHERHQDDRACLDTYREALQIIQAGNEQSLTNCSVAQIERALNRYGCLENRLHEYGDPMFDIDATGIAFARSSRVLHLLDYTVVYLAFLDRSGKCDDLWSPKDQVVIGQYFTWCECRRHRRRSGSLNPVELIRGQFLRKSSDDHGRIKSDKRQLSITRWLRRTIGGAGHKYNGENLPVPESEALEENATQKSVKGKYCPDANHCLSKFAVSKQQHNTSEFLASRASVELDPDTGDLTWVPFFLQDGDHELDLEHVAVANAIEIPVIRITGAARALAGLEFRPFSRAAVQMRIPTYFPKLEERFLDHRVSPPLENVQEE